MTIVLSGASGMLGSAIGDALRKRGTSVLRLVRGIANEPDELHWNPAADLSSAPNQSQSQNQNQLDASRIEGITAAVHLSGANVASRRWTPAFKKEMTQSRVATTRLLSEALARLKRPPQVLIAASAVGFYGDRGDEILDENSAPGDGFFPELCAAWESATRPAADAGIRAVHLRFGMVVGPNGGALARLSPLFRLGLGGRLGNGRQWMSWVSEADAVSSALFALDHPHIAGPINIAAPEPVTNAVFTRDLGRAVHRPTLLPAPAFALRLALGEMADAALLASTRAVPKRLQEAGFAFIHPNLPMALAAALAP
jgi:uncharacterized protein